MIGVRHSKSRTKIIQKILHIKLKHDHVSVLYDVFFSFLSHQPFFSGCCDASIFNKVIIGNYFGTDEAPLEIRMDFSRLPEAPSFLL